MTDLLSSPITDDQSGMRAALQWAARGLGWLSPRPSVGCVLVKEGRLLAGGHTQPGHGNPHAEIQALNMAQAAGENASGATAYVTLEPCSHFATTPPCSRALIQARVARVVCGVLDPNPEVNGRGMMQLREAGIEVRQLCVEECARMHEQFLVHIVQKRPFVTLKSAVSLDGKIAHFTGASKWITGETARHRVHQMRHEHDVVLIGIGTALADDPELTIRLEGQWKQPVRVVLDAQARLPLGSRLVKSASTVPLIVAVDENLPNEKTAPLEAAGAGVWRLPSSEGRIDLEVLLKECYEREWCSILVEGGAQVTAAFLEVGLADKATFFVAPLLMGNGISVTGEWTVENMRATRRLRAVQHESLEEDVLISGYLNDHVTRFFKAI